MPTYAYKCQLCGNVEEITHSMLDSPEVICKTCKVQMNRKPQVGAIQFVGGGFYSKDKGDKK